MATVIHHLYTNRRKKLISRKLFPFPDSDSLRVVMWLSSLEAGTPRLSNCVILFVSLATKAFLFSEKRNYIYHQTFPKTFTKSHKQTNKQKILSAGKLGESAIQKICFLHKKGYLFRIVIIYLFPKSFFVPTLISNFFQICRSIWSRFLVTTSLANLLCARHPLENNSTLVYYLSQNI